ncbi:helix-turn-helix domain-containing protein [Nocardia sp. NPDC057668]|uniref:helix-turn-helix domain-containing protein n=1 Tax=Nocardia sp. NPDC057668 TaxID=3346202 RepID=UPI00366AC37E
MSESADHVSRSTPVATAVTIVFDTRVLAPHERADAVCDAMQTSSVPSHVAHEDPGGAVHGVFEMWEFGAESIFRAEMSGIRLRRTVRQVRGFEAPMLAIAVQQRGLGEYEQFGEQRLVPVNDLHVMDLNAPYDFRWSGRGTSTCLYVPLDRLDLPAQLVRSAAPLVRESPIYPLLVDHILAMTAAADALSADASSAYVGSAATELVRGLLLSAARPELDATIVPARALLPRIRAYALDHLGDPNLDAATIARAHGVSVRYLYKICAAADFTLAAWILAQRLERVKADLSGPLAHHRSIGSIASRWGFRDHSHFTRRFRQAYGMTPSEWRSLSAPGS